VRVHPRGVPDSLGGAALPPPLGQDPAQTQYHTLFEIIYTVVPIVMVLVLFYFSVVTENSVDAVPAPTSR